MTDTRTIWHRLTSTKLWLALGSFITLAANEQWTEAMGVIGAYLAAEGAIGYRHIAANEKVEVAKTEAKAEIVTAETTAKADVAVAKEGT